MRHRISNAVLNHSMNLVDPKVYLKGQLENHIVYTKIKGEAELA